MKIRHTTRLAARAALPAALAVAPVVAPAVAAPAVAAEGGNPRAYQIDLAQLNDSGASGTAMLSLEGRQLTVMIRAEGLVPGQPHAQHIHGSTDGHDFHCPDAGADRDGDGIVTTSEGLPVYGGINISLTTEGDTSPDSGLAVDRMPAADANGTLRYERTLVVAQDVADHIRDLHVVQHGIDRNGNAEYDFGAGRSDLDPKLPQEATAPAACGLVEGAAVGSVPVGGVETGTGPAGDARTGTAPAGDGSAPAPYAAAGTLLAAAGGALALSRRRAALRNR
ncbi:hypothetical protein [Streptomyces lycii]|uniref:CHRD domain-containing protein n=1 Tax=Streptomyces lycii TaxID=2654337 RepID=A0ABQ7FG89_9ACTN|nr:hypothetical protein [Streptomyces lycii]KAF4407850.1 hypothetical protein GCU69_17265 [Streptomyces lycii]